MSTISRNECPLKNGITVQCHRNTHDRVLRVISTDFLVEKGSITNIPPTEDIEICFSAAKNKNDIVNMTKYLFIFIAHKQKEIIDNAGAIYLLEAKTNKLEEAYKKIMKLSPGFEKAWSLARIIHKL